MNHNHMFYYELNKKNERRMIWIYLRAIKNAAFLECMKGK